ncbi:MAG: hypothetical protein RR720_10010 [Comamonas sp.]|uniref:hypothetical protein n=1 Tax=Comamonas sp. TaxID=34028 RepID=UPI002FC67C97
MAPHENGHCFLKFDDIHANIEAIAESTWAPLYSSPKQVSDNAGRDVYALALEAHYFFE